MMIRQHLYKKPLRDFEKNIVEFFEENADFLGTDLNSKTIFAYFLIHHKLSKENLMNLTSLNSESISSSLKILIKKGCIQSDSSLNPNNFEISLFSFSYLENMTINNTKIAKWRKLFIDIKCKLINNFQNVVVLSGYYEIYTWVEKILNKMPTYDEHFQLLSDVKDKFTIYFPFSTFFSIL